MKILATISNFFSRVVAAITWQNTVTALKFLNVTDAQTGYLAPPKVLAWFLSIGICYAMFQLGDDQMDLGVFAGAIATLVGAFAAAYKLALDGDTEDDDRGERKRRRYHDEPYGVEAPKDEGPTP